MLRESTDRSDLDFLMGTDPEFVVATKQGEIIKAADYVPTLQDDPDAEFGADGHPYLLELRVPPGNPEQLVESVRDNISRNKHRMPEDSVWLAGAFKFQRPIGGHIHFGIPFEERFGFALDFALSQILILLENKHEATLRRANGGTYGRLFSDEPDYAVRYPPHGWEYRTPPSFFLSPSISLGVLALAKAIIYEEVGDFPNRVGRVVRKLPGDVPVPRRDFNRADKDFFYERLPRVWKVISEYAYWKTEEGKNTWRYVAGLRRIINQIAAGNYEDWENGKDLLHRWDLRRTDLTLQNIPKPITRVEMPGGVVGVDQLWELLFANEPPTPAVVVQTPAGVEDAPAVTPYEVAAITGNVQNREAVIEPYIHHTEDIYATFLRQAAQWAIPPVTPPMPNMTFRTTRTRANTPTTVRVTVPGEMPTIELGDDF